MPSIWRVLLHFWLVSTPSRCLGSVHLYLLVRSGRERLPQAYRSRKSIQDEWKKNKPVAEKRPSATTLRSNALAERLKTERKAKAAASGAQPTSEADEDQEDLDSDDLAFAGSDDDDLDLLSDMPDSEDLSDIDSTDLESDEDLSEDDEGEDSDEQAERAYAALRKRQDAQDAVEDANDSSKRRKLPTKLPDGFVQYINQPFEAQDNPVASTSRSSVKLPQLDSDESDAEDSTAQEAPRVADPLGPRFGRAGIKNLLQLPKRSERVSLAKSELATLSGDIMADPENSVCLLISLALTSH